MSLEQAKLFIERLKTDEEFREKIMTVEDVAERIRVAHAEGYNFTEEEIMSVSDESGDAVVEGVAGGAGAAEGCGFPWVCNKWCPAFCCHDWAKHY